MNKEYRVYYKDRNNKTWEEWYEPAGVSLKEANIIKKRVENIPTVYDVKLRLANIE